MLELIFDCLSVPDEGASQDEYHKKRMTLLSVGHYLVCNFRCLSGVSGRTLIALAGEFRLENGTNKGWQLI